MRNALALALLLIVAAPPSRAAPVRVKELAKVQGVRENELFGYGLVVGLAGTGDTERVFFTSQSISSMLGRMGIRIDPREVRVRNVAAVMVTARLPPFSRPGGTLDVSVSSMGNARSLAGGVLLVTPLMGADGAVYALAQGPVQVGGFDASASGSSIRKNHPTAGRVPNGATIEKSVAIDLGAGPLVFALAEPDFTTASRVAAAFNATLGDGAAKALDPASVEVTVPEGEDRVGLIARLEALSVDADSRAKVAISERTGTVVAGANVRIRPVAVAHGALRITVQDTPLVSQPEPFSDGRTVRDRYATVDAQETGRGAVALPATSNVDDLVRALDSLGVPPRDLIAILQAIKAAGALDAELEVL